MTTEQDQQSRAEFEAHALSQGWAYRDPQYGMVFYDHLPKVIAWKSWQAARALPADDDALLPIAAKSHGAWDGLEELLALPDGTEVYTAAQVQAMGRVPVESALNSFESAVSAYTGYIQRGGSPLDAEAKRLKSIKDDLRASIIDAPPPQSDQQGELVITTDEAGAIVAVTRQDDEGRILSVLAESEVRSKPLTDEQIEQATGAKRGHPLFLAAKGFTIAVEAAHGINHPTGD